MRQIATVAVIVFASASLFAQGKAVCSLLTATEVSALGATGQGIPGEMPISDGSKKGDTMKMCSWRMNDGGLHLSLATAPPGMSSDAVLDKVNKPYEQLKSQGWKEEKKDFGNVSCILMTPPAGQKDAPANTSCLTVAKGMMVSAATVTRTIVPMSKIKALVESASGRL